jgi:filamentous hemagglutinin family protein
MKLRDCLFIFDFLLNSLIISQPTLAQVIPDGSTPTDIGSCKGRCTIAGGTTRGTNLFHSFQQFDVGRGQEVRFISPNGIENIFSRVTGRNSSHIQGTLGVEGGANLFLLNPNGILFGRDARLDIQGSFIATTANRFIFAGGNEFSATNHQAPPLLAIHVPSGLQFEQTSREIRNQGILEVNSGRTLALIGSGLLFQGGRLAVERGQVELASIAEGQVNLQQIQQRGFDFRYEQIRNFRNISLDNHAVVDTSGEIGGAIQFWGRDISFNGRARISSVTSGSGLGRTVAINASGDVDLRGGSVVQTATAGKGRAGDVTIRASNSVNLAGRTPNFLSFVSSQVCLSGENCENVTGNGGDVTVITNRLQIHNGGDIEALTDGVGQGGDILVRAVDIELSRAVPEVKNGQIQDPPAGIFAQGTVGDAGNITIRTERLIVQGAEQINAASFGKGDAGNITITASDFVHLSEYAGDFSTQAFAESGIFASSESLTPGSAGNAGRVIVNTRALTLADGAAIAARDFAGARGGNITIRAALVNLTFGRLTAFSAAGSSNRDGSGSIQIENPNLVLMQNGSRISASSKTDISTLPSAGNVIINAPNGFIVATPGQDNDIIAGAIAGQGGAIDLTAQGIFGFQQGLSLDNETNDIDAKSELNGSGTVTLNTLDIDPTQGLEPLTTVPAPPQPIQGCESGDRTTTAAFFNSGRGGIPPTPYEPLSSSEILDDVRLPAAVATAPEPIVEAQGWQRSETGAIVLTATAAANGFQSHCRLH